MPAPTDLRERIELALEPGQVRHDVEPEVLLDVVGGATLMALALRPGRTLDERLVDGVVDLLTRGVVP